MSKLPLSWLKGRKQPPVIETPYGPVTEWARRQAALNMRSNPDLKQRVMEVLIQETGSQAKAKKEFARRYPEALGGE